MEESATSAIMDIFWILLLLLLLLLLLIRVLAVLMPLLYHQVLLTQLAFRLFIRVQEVLTPQPQ
jgi:hypothetical protein